MKGSAMLKQAATAVSVRSTTASGSVVYESERAVNEYLQFHYGDPKDIVPFPFVPRDALTFLPQTVDQCAALVPDSIKQSNTRALDIGCAVGRATFELSRHFNEAIGIDFSHHFVEAAESMRVNGSMEYIANIQGEITQKRIASLPENVFRDRVSFQQGDACNLSQDLGTFDAVFASNLLCRLPEPRKFLHDLRNVIKPNGILALVSPYSWLEEYTDKDKWIGATIDKNGKPIESFQVIQELLQEHFTLVKRQDYPFLIREHERKYQWGVSDGTFWQKK